MSRRWSILIVGVGSIGERHLRCFGATSRADLSLCEIQPGLRETVAGRYKVQGAFARLQDALEAKPEAVVICAPAHTHVPLAIEAARSGAHLLIEKPLSAGHEGIDQLQDEIARRGLTAAVAYVYRAHPVLASMKAAIEAGEIGKPLEIVVVAGQHFPFYRPAYRDTYYRSRSTGGGAIQDAITHLVNAAEWLVGPVDSLVADADHLSLPGVEVEDTVHVLTRHGRVMGALSLNQHQAPNETSITVIGDRGTARFEMHRCQWARAAEPGGPWQIACKIDLERDDLFTRQAEAFLDAIEGRQPPLCTIEEGIQTLRVNLAMLDSWEQRAWRTIQSEGIHHG
ncbi:MAG: Gfo/Idh/MocA family oxidoreductase [Verrucomicrobia bacterium]|nr:Gfo/Idh/MocA family oxidoreductase [Verrucomicrobiota bacterium]